MDAILNFKQAAKALQNDERYLTLQKARQANDNDSDLQNKIGDFNLLRLDLNNEMAKDDADQQKVDEMNTRINRLYGEIMANANMVAYNKAKDDIERFMDYVNAILNAAIDGQDPMQVEEPAAQNCSAGCASCSGCH